MRLFDDNSPAAKDLVPPCALGNVYVHVQKRAGDKYQCNETNKLVFISHVQATKLFLIMQHYVCNIILIREFNKVYEFIKFLS